MLHEGSGELHTVTGVSLVDAHRPTREDSYRLSVGLVGAEAMLRLFVEEERNERAFEALTRFLSAVDAIPAGHARPGGARPGRARVPAQAALALRLRPAPRGLRRVRRRRRARRLPRARRRSGVLALRTRRDGVPRAGRVPRHRARSSGARSPTPRARARRARAARRAGGRRRVVRVPRRLPAAHARRMRRDLGDGYELDDDPGRIDRDAVHAYLGGVSYWAKGRPRDAQDALIDGAAARRRPVPRRRADRLLADALRRARAVVPRGRLRARRAPRSRPRRRARPLHGRGGAVRRDEVVPAHARRARPLPQVRLRGAERARARARSPEPTARRRCSRHDGQSRLRRRRWRCSVSVRTMASAAPPTAGCSGIIDPDYASAQAWRPERVVLGVVDVPSACHLAGGHRVGRHALAVLDEVRDRRSSQQPRRSRLGARALEAAGSDRLGRRAGREQPADRVVSGLEHASRRLESVRRRLLSPFACRLRSADLPRRRPQRDRALRHRQALRLVGLRRRPVRREPVLHERARARDRDPLLRERVAVADRDRVVLERLRRRS